MSHPAIEQTKSLLPAGQDASIADGNTTSRLRDVPDVSRMQRSCSF